MKKNKDTNIEKTDKSKTKRKKMTAYQKRKLIMKFAGWIMAIVMILGSLISIFGMLIYY